MNVNLLNDEIDSYLEKYKKFMTIFKQINEIRRMTIGWINNEKIK